MHIGTQGMHESLTTTIVYFKEINNDTFVFIVLRLFYKNINSESYSIYHIGNQTFSKHNSDLI